MRSFFVGLTGLVAFAFPLQFAFAAAGDDPASVIETRTGPGETTSQSCGSNRFIDVTFLLGSTVVSTIESGTPCSGGGGGGGSTPLSADLQSMVERDLLEQRLDGMAQNLLENLDELSQEELEEGIGAGEDAQNEENPEFSDEEKSALLSDYKSQVANARADLIRYRSEISEMRSELKDASIEAAQRMPQLDADLKAAEAVFARVGTDVENLPTARALATAEKEFQARQEEMQVAQELADDPTYHRPTYIQNVLGATRIRFTLAQAKLAEANAAHAAAKTALETSAQADVQRAEAAIADNIERVKILETGISKTEYLVSSTQHNITRLEGLIRALEQQNQFAGPSGDTFKALRARGLEFWSRGSVAFADDTQAGRNQEIEQQEVTLGLHGRFSERFLAGLAVSFVTADNKDQTGTAISTDTETFMFAPYFAYQLSDDLALDAGAVYGLTDVSLTRATTATASHDATTLGGQIGLSVRHRLSEVVSLTGRVGQSYVTTDSDGYTDTGGVTVASSDSEQAATSFSGRIYVSTDPDWRWHGALRVQYDTIDPGNGLDRLYGRLSTGLEYNPGPYAVAVQANRSVFRSNYQATGLSLQVRVPF